MNKRELAFEIARGARDTLEVVLNLSTLNKPVKVEDICFDTIETIILDTAEEKLNKASAEKELSERQVLNQEQYFIDKFEELMKEFNDFECKLIKERNKSNTKLANQEKLQKICKECKLNKYQVVAQKKSYFPVIMSICDLLDE